MIFKHCVATFMIYHTIIVHSFEIESMYVGCFLLLWTWCTYGHGQAKIVS